MWSGTNIKTVNNINGYLLPLNNIVLNRITDPISNLPPICKGSMPRDNGALIFTKEERDDLLEKNPEISEYIKPYVGSSEFIKGTVRYCFWVDESFLDFSTESEQMNKRLQEVTKFRLNSDAPSTQIYADRPYLFVQRTYKEEDFVLLPEVSSSRRE